MDGIGGVAQEKHLLDAADGTGDLPLIQTGNTLRGESPILQHCPDSLSRILIHLPPFQHVLFITVVYIVV